MKKLLFILPLICISSYLFSQQVHVDNQTGCYYIINLDQSSGCNSGGTNGPFDAPDNSYQTYDLSIDPDVSVPSDVESIQVNEFGGGSGGSGVTIQFSNCGSDSSPKTTSLSCDNLPLKVSWSTCSTDFCITLYL